MDVTNPALNPKEPVMEPSPCARCGSRDRSAGYGLCAQCLLAAALRPAELPADDRFGNYEPVAVLGEGGMGIIYLAEQTAPLRRTVALKVLKEGSGGHGFKERFDRERQSLARLSHPHIAAIYDAGASERGVPFFVMEYVEGSPITTWCKQRRLSIGQRLTLFQQVCQAVEHAHQRGILHRDLKPSNLLVSDTNGLPQAKVIDFGLARLEDWHGFSREQLTGVAQIMGTPEYMSPEQAAGLEAEIDRQTDVYSLGIVLYELLVGALPWEASAWGSRSAAEILRVIRDLDMPPPEKRFRALAGSSAQIAAERQTDARSLRRELAGDLGAIIRKATHRETEYRYTSAESLCADIGRYLQSVPVEARHGDRAYRLRKRLRRHAGAFGAVAVVIALAAVATLAYFGNGGARKRELAVERIVPFTAFDGYETTPSFSPDGSSIVFTWGGADDTNTDLYTVSAPGEPPRRLTTHPEEDLNPVWSPDGRRIAFLRGPGSGPARLMLLDLASGEEQEIRTLTAWYGKHTKNLAWMPNGQALVVLQDGPNKHALPQLLDLTTGRMHPLLRVNDDAEYLHPAISPDGRRLAFLRDDLQTQRVQVQELSATWQPLGPPKDIATGKLPAWGTDGALYFQSWEGNRARLWRVAGEGEPPRPMDQFGDRVTDFALAPASNRIALCRSVFDADLWLFRLNGQAPAGDPEVIAASTYDELDPELSPTGDRVAFVSTRSGNRQLWLASLDSSAPRQLTFGEDVRRGPGWLADGRTLRYGTRTGDVRKFWLLDTATGKTRFERDDIYIEATAAAGESNYFRQAVGQQDTLFVAPKANPEAARPVSPRPCFHSQYAPAGDWVYCTDRGAGPAALRRIARDRGSAEELVARDVLARAFAVTRSGVYFARKVSATSYGIYFQAAPGREPVLLKQINRRPTGRLSVSADERTLLLDVATREGADILLATVSSH